MRGLVEGLTTRCPLGRLLPMLYQDDDFALRFTSALDEVLAPALWALDDLDAYVDPGLAPPDFLEWLAAWLGIDLDQTWPEERRRTMLAGARGEDLLPIDVHNVGCRVSSLLHRG